MLSSMDRRTPGTRPSGRLATAWARFAFPVIGGFVALAATAAGLVLSVGLAFGHSVCSADPAQYEAAATSLRTDLCVVWAGVTAVPLLTAGVAHHRGRRVAGWVTVAALAAAAGLYLAVTTEPSTWCLY